MDYDRRVSQSRRVWIILAALLACVIGGHGAVQAFNFVVFVDAWQWFDGQALDPILVFPILINALVHLISLLAHLFLTSTGIGLIAGKKWAYRACPWGLGVVGIIHVGTLILIVIVLSLPMADPWDDTGRLEEASQLLLPGLIRELVIVATLVATAIALLKGARKKNH